MNAEPYYAPTYFPTSYFFDDTAASPASPPTGLLPYYAPTYFPASYFYVFSGPVGVPTPTPTPTPTGQTPYDAPTYFPPAYFYGAPSTSVIVPVVPEPPGVSQDAYAAMLGLIQATGLFEEVIFGASTRRSQAGADTYPLAVLTPRGWEESDEVDPTSIVRRTSFSVTVVVKSQDDSPEFDLLDCLSSAIKAVIDRSDLGGTCLPALTWIRSGRYEYSNHYPEQSIDLEGEFSSILDPTANVPGTS